MKHSLSIIIPTLNEESTIGSLLFFLLKESRELPVEILIADGGSSDATLTIVKSFSEVTVVSCPERGRGQQMNFAAAHAQYKVLYFLHADSRPPFGFIYDINKAVANKYKAGCFRLKFYTDHWFLKANAWFTRFNVSFFRFGDQSLFVTQEVFNACGGFRNDYLLLEDQEIITRIQQYTCFKVLPSYVVTSARKYHQNGAFRLQGIYFRIWLNYKLGASQEKLMHMYKRKVK